MNDITPDRAVLLLQKLSALLGSVNEEWIVAEMKYNRLYEELTDTFEKVSEAKAKAKASPLYEEKLKAEGLIDSTRELMNSLKYTIRLRMEEGRESKWQT